jgi:hypothetical protein
MAGRNKYYVPAFIAFIAEAGGSRAISATSSCALVRLRLTRPQPARVKSMIQLVSQLRPSSAEKACSQRAPVGVIALQR